MFCRAIVGIGGAGHQDDRQVLGVGAGDRIDCRKPADAKGDHGSSRTTSAGVSLGAVAAIQFVAAIDLFQVLISSKVDQARPG
jgi:hypothetical protein